MPLSFANEGMQYRITHVGGAAQIRQHLADMGFNVGGNITIISRIGDNYIVKVKGSRIGISREMASKIMV